MKPKKKKEFCIKITRRVLSEMPVYFNGIELIDKVRIEAKKQKQKRYFDCYILREMRKLRKEKGSNFICLSKPESKYLKVSDDYI